MKLTLQALITLLLSSLAVSTMAKSRLYIHNNTDTAFKVSVTMGKRKLSTKRWRFKPKVVNPYQHVSVLRVNRRKGLKKGKNYYFLVKLTPAETGRIRSTQPFIIRLKVRHKIIKRPMYHSFQIGRRVSKWYTDKKWRRTRWGRISVRFRERIGVPDANVEFRFTAPSRKILRLPFANRKKIDTAPFKGPFHYDVHETKGDKNNGKRSSSGIKGLNCKTYNGKIVPNCYGGHTGTDYMLKGGFKKMDKRRNYIVAARGGIVKKVQDCYYDRCRLKAGKTKPTCFGKNKDKHGNKMQANYITIEHDDGTRTKYVHIKKNSAIVGEGEIVKCGQKIAEVGSSGKSVGPHLHFVVQVKTNNGWHAICPYKGKLTGRTFWYKKGTKSKPSSVCAPRQPYQRQWKPLPTGRKLVKRCSK